MIHTDYDGVLIIDGLRCQDYMHRRSLFYRALVPALSIRSTVSSILGEYFDDRLMVGIHVRDDVPGYDWAVVPPAQGGSTAQTFSESASIRQFESAMRSVEDYFGSNRVRFFIASNNPDAKVYLRDRFTSSVALMGDFSRSTSDGIKFALMEWLILAESSMIIHTFGSTFAEEAAQKHLIPVFGIYNDHIIRHSDVTILLCGHQLFIAAYGITHNPGAYIETGAGGRKIQSAQIQLIDCNPDINYWGLLAKCNSAAL